MTEDVANVHNLCLRSLKRTHDMFLSNYGAPITEDESSQRLKLLVKINDEYSTVKDMPAPQAKAAPTAKELKEKDEGPSAVNAILGDIEQQKLEKAKQTATGIIEYQKGTAEKSASEKARALVPRKPVNFQKPVWHAPWKLMRVISGHLGAVRCVAVDPTNEWFATGAGDRTIKIWDLASGKLRLTLTGHINAVRAVCISPRHPYLFSVGEDKMVKCWDLEYNKVIRHYHGHLSGVYCASLHPTLDLLITGGRDSAARVWDMRTKAQVHVLAGHNNTVMSVETLPTDPQVITGSMDTTVKLWDMVGGKTMCTLTNHKKGVRALAIPHNEYAFISGAADNIKKWRLPHGNFFQNLTGHNAIVNCLAVNQDGVLMSGGDNGTMHFWDYKSGYNFQSITTLAQPGSLESENGIFAATYDHSGTRLITAEADKSIKVWREDETATPESHPVTWKPTTHVKRY